MQKFVLLAIAVAATLGAFCFAYLARNMDATDALVPVEQVHDLGELAQGDVVGWQFELVNRFSQPAQIENVVTSCGCSQAECSKQTIAPDEHITVKTEWRVGPRRGRCAILLTLLVRPSGGTLHETSLKLTGSVVPDINYSPEALVLRQGSDVAVVDFAPGRMPEFVLKRAYCSHRAFEASVLPNGRSVRVVYRRGVLLDGLNKAELLVETSSPNEPTCRIPILIKAGPAPSKAG